MEEVTQRCKSRREHDDYERIS